MNSIEHTSQSAGLQVEEVIFAACRNNEARTERFVSDHLVTFTALPNDTHRAAIWARGSVIARAVVDRLDA